MRFYLPKQIAAVILPIALIGGCQAGDIFYRPRMAAKPQTIDGYVLAVDGLDSAGFSQAAVLNSSTNLSRPAGQQRLTVADTGETPVPQVSPGPREMPMPPIRPEPQARPGPHGPGEIDSQPEAPTSRPADSTTEPTEAATQPVEGVTRPVEKMPYTSPLTPNRYLSVFLTAGMLGATREITGAGKEVTEARVSLPGRTLGAAGLSAPQPYTMNAVINQPGLHRGYAAGLGFAARQTLLTAQWNTPCGPCRGLVRAGFFSSQSACAAHFRR